MPVTIALMILAAVPVYAIDNGLTIPATVNLQTAPPAVLNPQTAKDFNQRGITKAQSGDLEGAIADFSQAIRLKLDYATAYYHRGTAYARTGNARAALADYTQVILLKPNNADVRYSRGSLRVSLGDKQGAIDDFQQAASLYKQQLNLPQQQKALNQLNQLQSS